MDDTSSADICRVCRCEAAPDKPLFHPCICTGSIKFIHQDCLVQWLKYSEKEYCELCNYRFSFIPIYSPDMPKSLPVRDIVSGLVSSLSTALRFWLQLTLVAVAWLGVVPLTAYRIYKCLFSGSASAIFSLPLDLLSTDSLMSDAFYGCCVVTCTLCSFISLVWLREQILRAGPEWLINNNPVAAGLQAAAAAAANHLPNHHPHRPVGDQDEQEDEEEEVDHRVAEEDEEAAAAAGAGHENNEHEDADNHNNGAPVGDEDGGGGGGVADGVDGVAPAAAAAAGGGGVGGWVNGGGGGVGAAGLDGWDRAAEELTWERILGLDGSLVFLEHVLWVICLNTLFIMIFAFAPYHIGNQVVSRVEAMKEAASVSQFSGLVTTLVGYVVIGLFLVLMHAFTCLFNLRKSQQILGLCYVTVKVSLLSVFELGVFPLVCGCWLDICSLPMLGSRLEDRQASFRAAPGTSLFIHWLVGMIYVFYFASFILLLREVVRPGVLWFLQNLNDPDFNPIQEMIHLPIVGHARRFLASLVIFGSTVLLTIWVPVMIVQQLVPGLLPFHVSIYSPVQRPQSIASADNDTMTSVSMKAAAITTAAATMIGPAADPSAGAAESQVGELSLEFLLLQLVLPALLDHGHLRLWLKSLIRTWCLLVSCLLDIRSYLLGDIPIAVLASRDDGDIAAGAGDAAAGAGDAAAGAGDAAAGAAAREEEEEDEEEEAVDPHEEDDDEDDEGEDDGEENLLIVEDESLLEDATNMPYLRPAFFPLRIFALLLLIAVSLLASGVLMLSLPVMTGRKLISLWMGDVRVHELNTAACGLYVGLVTLRLLQLLGNWAPRGMEAILCKLREGLLILAKTAVAGFVLLGVIPLLIGILFDVVIIVPLRVPLNQTPIFYLWQDWAFGVLHTKVICGIAMLGDFRLRRLLEQMYQAGLVRIDLHLILWQLAAPVVAILGLALSLPYLLVTGLAAPLFAASFQTETLILRRVYPFLLFASVLLFLVTWHVNKYWRLLEHIKNDKYLVGKRLVNYDPKGLNQRSSSASGSRKQQPHQQQQQQQPPQPVNMENVVVNENLMNIHVD